MEMGTWQGWGRSGALPAREGMVSVWGVGASSWAAPGANWSVLGTKCWGATRSCCTPGAEMSNPGEMVGANHLSSGLQKNGLSPAGGPRALLQQGWAAAVGGTAAMLGKPLACAEGWPRDKDTSWEVTLALGEKGVLVILIPTGRLRS